MCGPSLVIRVRDNEYLTRLDTLVAEAVRHSGDESLSWAARYPFGGFRRTENLEVTSRKEAILSTKGRPVALNIQVVSYQERGQWVERGGIMQLRLHRTYKHPGGAWVILTGPGSHGIKDRRGNVREPLWA